jgi:hypothetical protein
LPLHHTIVTLSKRTLFVSASKGVIRPTTPDILRLAASGGPLRMTEVLGMRLCLPLRHPEPWAWA